jgi:hypothetical protein
MSMLTPDGRITVRPFSSVPALGELPELRQRPGPLRNNSLRHGVDLAKGRIVTKSIRYTHQLAHWVNAVRQGGPDASEVVSTNY